MVSCIVCALHKGTLLGEKVSGGRNQAPAQLVKVSALVGVHPRTHLIPISK